MPPVTAFDDADLLPDGPGAYGLIIDVGRGTRIAGRGGRAVDLPAGLYLYAGSAYGPGGIRARVRRHLKAAKTVRWHVDRLTNVHGVAAVVAVPGGRECGLIDAARAWPGTTVPAPGLGSSDCRRCPAHLVRLPDGTTVDDLYAAALATAAGGRQAVTWRPPPAVCFPSLS